MRSGRGPATLHPGYPGARRGGVGRLRKMCQLVAPAFVDHLEPGGIVRAVWCGGCVAVSRFFCFPIQMNFAEIQKWPRKPAWRGAG